MPIPNHTEPNTGSHIPNDLLREFARGKPEWTTGNISAEDQAILCMNLQDLAGELLAFRLRSAARREIHVRNRIAQVIRKRLARRASGACHAN